jgi:hypothetical protein
MLSLIKNKVASGANIVMNTLTHTPVPENKVGISSTHNGIMLLILAKFDPDSFLSECRVPSDVVNYIVLYYTHFMDPMKHIKVHSVESEYDTTQWIKEHTLDFRPESDLKGWFSAINTKESWIIYDLGHPCFLRKFKIKINSNGVKSGNFEISPTPTGPWKIWHHFTTPPQDSLPKDWVKIKLDDNVISRYVRINCLESHGTPTGFYKIVFS